MMTLRDNKRRVLSSAELADLLSSHGYKAAEIAAIKPRELDEIIDRLTAARHVAVSLVPITHHIEGYHSLTSVIDLRRWLADRDGKLSAVYFHGNLSAWRYSAAIQIRKLEKLQDAARPSRPRPSSEAVMLDTLQRTMELCRAVSQLADPAVGMLYLAQRKAEHEDEYFYICTRGINNRRGP